MPEERLPASLHGGNGDSSMGPPFSNSASSFDRVGVNLRKRFRRQLDDEFRERAGFGLHPDLAAVLADDVARQREAQPGALVRRLGREEGVEDVFDDVGRDPASVVPDAYFDPLGGAPGDEGERGLVRAFLGAPPLGGRLAGIADQVQEDAAHVLSDHVERSHRRIEVLDDVELKALIACPGAVVGEPHMLVQQGVDVRRLPAARITPHAEHVLHDLVCALAVLPDQSEVFRDVGADFSN